MGGQVTITSLIYYFLFVLSVRVSQVFCGNVPVIYVVSIRQMDTHQWVEQSSGSSLSYTKQGDDYTLSSDIGGLKIKCTASYPVLWKRSWKGAISNLRTRYMYTEFEREFPYNEFNNTSTYKYSSTLVIRLVQKDVIGNYSCNSVHGETVLQKSIYIYTEEVFPPYLIYASKTREIGIDNQDTITLPCKVFSPDAYVTLYKEDIGRQVIITITNTTVTGKDTNSTETLWLTLYLNDSISYDPKIGFQMKVNQLPGILGRYKCSTDEPGDLDYVYVNVTRTSQVKTKTPYEDRKLVGNAKYFWNKNISVFSCCSNSDKAPKIILTYCRNSPSCETARIIMTRLLPVLLKRTQSLKIFLLNGVVTNGSCSAYPLYWGDLGYVVGCIGDGISLTTELYPLLAPTPFLEGNNETSHHGFNVNSRKTFDIVTSWDNTPRNKFIYVERTLNVMRGHYYLSVSHERIYNSNPEKIYSGEKIILMCHTSPIVFAEGIVWAMKMKNGSLNMLYNTTIEEPSTTDMYHQKMLPDYHAMQVAVDVESESIVCFGPVWNSSEWIPAYFKLEVQASTAPTVEGKQTETVYWTLNDTSMTLHCKASKGEPAPTLTWSKNGEVIIANNSDDLQQLLTVITNPDDNSSTLKVHLVSHETHGDFACSATNVAGSATKIFSVFVTEPHSLALIAGVSVIMVVFLSALISLLVYKMKKQNNSLTNLRTGIYDS